MWASRCEATTLKGRRCKKKKSDEHFCNIHIPESFPDNCPVCYNDIQEKVILECNHVFCDECIYKWICRNDCCTCPICRNSITDFSLKSKAWKYGVENKLLFLADTCIYDISLLDPLECETIKDTLEQIKGRLLTTTDFLLIMLTIEDDLNIFLKLTKDPVHIKRLVRLASGQTEFNNQEYHHFINMPIL
jgi:hypothetical protein